MFVEKVAEIMGIVPVQFDPILYVLSALLFLWLVDGFMWLCKYLVTGGR